MTPDELQDKLHRKLGRESIKWAAKALGSPRDNFDIAKFSYQAGFLKCQKLMMPLIVALEFECGNRCAQQNPCSAREAIENFKKELGT